MKSKLPITLVVIVRNEDKNLDKCISSCCDVVSEIIVIHDGLCNDDSINIAKKYNAKIVIAPREGQPEPHRATSYKLATYEWILQLDADERLPIKTKNVLAKLIDNDIDIYEFNWPVKDGKIFHMNFYKRFLFKKNMIYYIGMSHENVRPISKNTKIKKLDYVVYHYPSRDITNIRYFLMKYDLCAKLQAKQLHDGVCSLNNFNYGSKKFPKDLQMIVRHPYLSAILIPIYLFYKSQLIALNNISRINYYVIFTYPISYTLYYWKVILYLLKRDF